MNPTDPAPSESKTPGEPAFKNEQTDTADPQLPDPGSPDDSSAYQVDQEAFKGPLETLVRMVREHDLDIFTVSLSAIADEFFEYVQALEERDLDEIGMYLVLASGLLVLKSRRLLPTETEVVEEEPADEEALLLKRLRDYEAFKEAADLLRRAENERRRLYIREKPPPTVGEPEVIDVYEVDILDLAAAFQRVMDEIGDNTPNVIQGEEYTLDEKMAELQLLLQDTGEMCLTLYLGSLKSRVEVIVTFLALLELIRLLKIRARQSRIFGDIWIYRTDELSRDPDGEAELAVAGEDGGYPREDTGREVEETIPETGTAPNTADRPNQNQPKQENDTETDI